MPVKCDVCSLKNRQNPIICGECMEGLPVTNTPITNSATVSAGYCDGEIITLELTGCCPTCGSPIFKTIKRKE
jgi:hypothetical protein